MVSLAHLPRSQTWMHIRITTGLPQCLSWRLEQWVGAGTPDCGLFLKPPQVSLKINQAWVPLAETTWSTPMVLTTKSGPLLTCILTHLNAFYSHRCPLYLPRHLKLNREQTTLLVPPVMRWIVSPKDSYIKVLTPSNLKSDLLWT